jgi:hypothetical protein
MKSELLQTLPNGQVVTGCVGDNAAADGTSCVLAKSLDWRAAVIPPGVSWQDSLTPGGTPVLKCANTENDQCQIEASTNPFESASCGTGPWWFDCECPEECTYTDFGGDPLENTCLPRTGPLPASTDAGTGWADIISNYTTQMGTAWLGDRTKCEMALVRHTAVTETSSCRGAGEDVPAADAGTYRADCDACNEFPDFTFGSGIGSSYCLSYFVGLMEDTCVPRPDFPLVEFLPRDCDGWWSPCTAACEMASARIWTETQEQYGTGAACPAATACSPGEGTCPGEDGGGSTVVIVVVVVIIIALVLGGVAFALLRFRAASSTQSSGQ